ncbi:TPA: GPO family capsid scaffolding protein, partial [Burkholderia cepacia]|nr:GPO family capsid scaffolding protein [Burkholderia cepacia]
MAQDTTKTKFFCIATEGATTDGRKIDRAMLEQMASSYDPKTYGARINMEHIRGMYPDSAFRAYGDVIALKTEEQDGKLRLLAQLSPTKDLVEMTTEQRQKVYSSM